MSKLALIVGGTGGFGRAIAEDLAKRDYTIIIAGRNVEKGNTAVSAITSVDGKAFFIPCDVTNRSDITNLHAQVEADHGRLNVAVNTFGILGALKRTDLVKEAEMDTLFAINITGFYLCMQEQIRLMLASPAEGRNCHIINISSVYGLRGVPFGGLYSTSKHAVIGMTKSAAAEHAKHGIYINALAPGVIPTDMINEMMTQVSSEEADPLLKEKDFLAAYPAGRYGNVEDVIKAVAYLVENDWVAGSVLEIDGGFGAV